MPLNTGHLYHYVIKYRAFTSFHYILVGYYGQYSKNTHLSHSKNATQYYIFNYPSPYSDNKPNDPVELRILSLIITMLSIHIIYKHV